MRALAVAVARRLLGSLAGAGCCGIGAQPLALCETFRQILGPWGLPRPPENIGLGAKYSVRRGEWEEGRSVRVNLPTPLPYSAFGTSCRQRQARRRRQRGCSAGAADVAGREHVQMQSRAQDFGSANAEGRVAVRRTQRRGEEGVSGKWIAHHAHGRGRRRGRRACHRRRQAACSRARGRRAGGPRSTLPSCIWMRLRAASRLGRVLVG